MTIYFEQRGDSLDYTPNTDITAGTFIVQGALVGITKLDIANGELGAIHTSGVFINVPKGTGALNAGQIAYLDPTNKRIMNASASGYIPCGYVLESATSAATECKILLVPTGSHAA